MSDIKRVAPVRIGDLLLVVGLLAILFVFVSKPNTSESGSRYELYLSDSLLYSDSLHNDQCTVFVAQKPVVIQVSDSNVRFLHNDCPKNICVHSLPISHPGQEIICAPNRLVLKIAGERSFDADIIAR